ncbi:MAG: chorismate mutase [Promethearchaeota archaeon]
MKEKEFFERKLGKYRREIDKIDNKFINLLNKRGKIVQKIGILKNQVNKKIFQPQREKEIIERMKKKSEILKNVSIEAIWKEILSACKLIQGLEIKDEK